MKGGETMLDRLLRFGITVLMGIAGLMLVRLAIPYWAPLVETEFLNGSIFGTTLLVVLGLAVGMMVGGIIGYLISPWLIKIAWQVTYWMERRLNKMPLQDVIVGSVGLAIGLIIANLLGAAFVPVPIVGNYIPGILSILFGYLGINLILRKRDEIASLISSRSVFGKDRTVKDKTNAKPKILDTSVIIDGRIADILNTGFIDGTLVIPVFVLEELQHIADSSDLLRRTRGRRGLDILNHIQKETDLTVIIDERDFDDISEVDSKLIKLAHILRAKVITNDYNLNKVAEIQGVEVLNINELSNAIKPVVLPGEEMTVTIIKDGKEIGQGVAYLDDGTMIVVDSGKQYIGRSIAVIVTSVLQTAAGRMIFAKPKAFERGA